MDMKDKNIKVISTWKVIVHKGEEFTCDHWDCPTKIKDGDKYLVEEYPKDNQSLSYCLECGIRHIAQVGEQLIKEINR
jgi:hypothetical protein